jgi:hypothetical protein
MSELAILRDERDLLWLAFSDLSRHGGDVLFAVHFCAREEPGEPPTPFLSAAAYREPVEGMLHFIDELGLAVAGDVSALRYDPISDGLSMELKAHGRGADLTFEVVLWLDLTRMGPAMKARAVRGRHQAGLRMHVTRAGLEAFRESLFALAFDGGEK